MMFWLPVPGISPHCTFFNILLEVHTNTFLFVRFVIGMISSFFCMDTSFGVQLSVYIYHYSPDKEKCPYLRKCCI